MIPSQPEKRRVLIWGKTYPELSTRYKETVCTGGSFEDGTPVRLYPVPLRYLPDIRRYRLFEWVEATLEPSTNDSRPESYRLAAHDIERHNHLDTADCWAKRREIIFANQTWHYECLEELKRREREDRSSLGFVPVGRVDRVWLDELGEDARAKHEQRRRVIEEQLKQNDLFRNEPEVMKALEFQPFRVRIEWHCRCDGDPTQCPGHTAAVLDWGLGELGRREGWDKALQKMQSLCDLEEYELALFMGNIKAHPMSFTIVGLWYPKRGSLKQRKARRAGQLGLPGLR